MTRPGRGGGALHESRAGSRGPASCGGPAHSRSPRGAAPATTPLPCARSPARRLPVGRAGVTLIEVMLATLVLVIAAGGLTPSVLGSLQLGRWNEERWRRPTRLLEHDGGAAEVLRERASELGPELVAIVTGAAEAAARPACAHLLAALLGRAVLEQDTAIHGALASLGERRPWSSAETAVVAPAARARATLTAVRSLGQARAMRHAAARELAQALLHPSPALALATCEQLERLGSGWAVRAWSRPCARTIRACARRRGACCAR